MALNVFYSMVRESAEQLIRREPKLAFSANARLCAILTKNYDIVSGVSSIYMINQNAGVIPAEYMAVVAMNNADMTRALQMITISLEDFSVITPNASELLLVYSLDPSNTKCNVYISPSEYVPITSLLEDVSDYTEQFDGKNNNSASDNSKTDSTNANNLYDNNSANYSTTNAAEKTAEMSGFFSGFGDDEANDANVPDSSELERMGFITNSTPEQYQPVYNGNFSSAPANEEYSTGINIDESNPFLDSSENSNGNSDIFYFAELPNGENNNKAPQGANEFSESGTSQSEVISKDELMKLAKQKKKIARANFNIRKK